MNKFLWYANYTSIKLFKKKTPGGLFIEIDDLTLKFRGNIKVIEWPNIILERKQSWKTNTI